MSHKGKTLRGSDIILENSGKISGLRSLYFSNKFGNNYWNEEGVLSANKLMTNCITLENGKIEAHHIDTYNLDTFSLNTTQINILDENEKPKCGFFDGILKTAAIEFVDKDGKSYGEIRERKDYKEGINMINVSSIVPTNDVLEISGNLIVYGKEISVENVKNIVDEPLLTLGGNNTYLSYVDNIGIGVNHFYKGEEEMEMGFFGIYDDAFTHLIDIKNEDLSTGKLGNAKFEELSVRQLLTKSVESQNNLNINSKSFINLKAPNGIYFNSENVNMDSKVTTKLIEVKELLKCNNTYIKENIDCHDFSCNKVTIMDNSNNSNTLLVEKGELMLNGVSVHCKNIERHNNFNGGIVENPTTFMSDVKIKKIIIDEEIFCKNGLIIHTKEKSHTLVINKDGCIGINNPEPKFILDIKKKEGEEITLKTDGAIWAKGGIFTYNPVKNMKNIEKVNSNFALEYVNRINCYNYGKVDEISNLGFDTKEIKGIIPEAVYTIKDYIPNEMRDIKDYKWRKTKKQYKLTIHDLKNKEGYIKYKFLVKDNEDDEFEIIIRETMYKYPNAFKFDKKWNFIYLYGREVDNLHLLNKEKIYTLHHPAIQELYKKTKNLEIKLRDEEDKTIYFKMKILLLLETFANLNKKIENLEKNIKLNST